MNDIEKISALYAAFQEALRKGDGDMCASMCTENAVLMPPNELPVVGSEAIRQHFANLGPDSTVTGKALKTEISGKLAYQHSRMTWESDGKTKSTDSLDVLRQQDDGSWIFETCAWNSVEGFDQA